MKYAYLISYDIASRNKADEDRVLSLMAEMAATRTLYSEWLYMANASGKSLEIANRVAAVLSQGDGLLVVEIADSAWLNLRNPQKSASILNAA